MGRRNSLFIENGRWLQATGYRRPASSLKRPAFRFPLSAFGFPLSAFRLWLSAFSVLLSASPAYAQQSLQLTQYTFNGLAVNPAYAGYTEDWMLRGGYRLQWSGLDGAPKTGTLSIDGTLDDVKKNLGVGLLLTNDRLGPQDNSAAWLNLAYRLRLSADGSRRLAFGAGIGISRYRLDASGFDPVDVLDNNLPVNDASSLAPDLRAGIYYASPSFFAGFSAINLLGSQLFAGNNRLKQERHYYFTTGALLTLGSSFDLKPALLIKDELKGPTNIDISNYLAIRRTVWIGAAYRFGADLWSGGRLPSNIDRQDAFALLTQWYLKPHLRFGYSFDFATSRLSGTQNGTHEISLGISFPRKRERILSPRFF